MFEWCACRGGRRKGGKREREKQGGRVGEMICGRELTTLADRAKI